VNALYVPPPRLQVGGCLLECQRVTSSDHTRNLPSNLVVHYLCKLDTHCICLSHHSYFFRRIEEPEISHECHVHYCAEVQAGQGTGDAGEKHQQIDGLLAGHVHRGRGPDSPCRKCQSANSTQRMVPQSCAIGICKWIASQRSNQIECGCA
jgi:hypothetical protein